MTLELTELTESQQQCWLGLLDIATRLPDGWCLIGGQMVHLFCQERGLFPPRSTNDGDVVLDIRAQPNMLLKFTRALDEAGFTSTGVSPEGHQHRWVRESASIDILIPRGLGSTASARRGITGGTTLAARGTQQAINRSEPVVVKVEGRIGAILRPNMIGALVSKAAAFSVPTDRAKDRHITDFATLAALARGSDQIGKQLTTRDCHYLIPMFTALDKSRRLWVSIEGAERAILAIVELVKNASSKTGLVL